MLSTWIGAVVAIAFLIWLLGVGKRAPIAPGDDTDTPIDRDELAAAEDDVRRDRTAKPAADGFVDEEEDDWGPGAGPRP